MSKATAAAVLSGLLMLTGCGVLRDRSTDENTSGLVRDQPIAVTGAMRNYHLFVPGEPATASIVLLLHGNGGSADQLIGLDRPTAPYALWLGIAERENLLLVIPDGMDGPDGKQGWNDCRSDAPTNPTSDDVAFLATLLDEVQRTTATDSERVFVAGTSNGGAMAQRLAAEIPERLDAIAVVVASRPVNSKCAESSVPLPVLFMNGTDDPILPYEGGEILGDRGAVMATADTVSHWVDRNRSNGTPTRIDVADIDSGDGSTIVRLSYDAGSNGSPVEHYEVIGGGHTEPSIAERYSRLFKRVVGGQNGDLEMAETVWSFFDDQ